MGPLSLTSGILGLPEDQLQYVACLVVFWLIGLVYQKWLYNVPTKAKHLLSIFVSWTAIAWLFGVNSIFHSLLSSTMVYIVMRNVHKRYRPDIWCLAGSLVWVVLMQVHRMYWHYHQWNMHIVGVQMLLVIKFSEFSFTVASRPPEWFPDLLEYHGFIYFWPSVLVGPTTTFDQYRDFVKHNNNVPHTFTSSFPQIIESVFLTVFMIFGQMMYPYRYILSNDYVQWSLFRRLWYAYVAMVVVRTRYYFAWKMSHAAFISSGLTAVCPTLGSNVDISSIEFAENVRQLTNNWNKCTNNWLKNCVYHQVYDATKSITKSILTTNIVSALWHGLYPGYYLTFVTGGIFTTLGRSWYQEVYCKFISKCESRWIHQSYYWSSVTVMRILISYVSLPFHLYSFSDSLMAWLRLYFVGHILLAFGYLNLFVVDRISK